MTGHGGGNRSDHVRGERQGEGGRGRGREREVDFLSSRQPELQNEFQDSQGYTEKFCLGK